MTFTANNGCTFCGSDAHMTGVCPWKGKTLTFDLRGFIDALENVRCFHDMSADLIAEQVFEQASAAQSAPVVPEGWRLMVERLAGELEDVNQAWRDSLDDDMADVEAEEDFCDGTDELIAEASAMLAAAPQPAKD